MVPLCKYILDGDQPCEQAAIKGGHYCRHHQVVRKSVAAADEAAPVPLPFVYPSNHTAQLYNYFLLAQALNEGRLDLRTVNALIRILKACDASLKASVAEGEQLSEADLSSEPEAPGVTDQGGADEEEPLKIAAAGEPARVRYEPTYPAQQTRDPLELLRHSRSKSGRKRR